VRLKGDSYFGPAQGSETPGRDPAAKIWVQAELAEKTRSASEGLQYSRFIKKGEFMEERPTDKTSLLFKKSEITSEKATGPWGVKKSKTAS